MKIDTLSVLKRLRRATYCRPGGGRLDYHSQGYDKAMVDFRNLISKEVERIKNAESNVKADSSAVAD